MGIPEFSLTDHRGETVTQATVMESAPALIVLLRGLT